MFRTSFPIVIASRKLLFSIIGHFTKISNGLWWIMDFLSFFFGVGEWRWNLQRFSFTSLSIPKPQTVWNVVKLGKNLTSKCMKSAFPGLHLKGHWSGLLWCLFCLGGHMETNSSTLCWKAGREKRELVTYSSFCKMYTEKLVMFVNTYFLKTAEILGTTVQLKKYCLEKCHSLKKNKKLWDVIPEI